jgi:hypothetical protein
MFRPWPWLTVVALLPGALAIPVKRAEAEEGVARLGEQLSRAADFRVRTQAALALGASRDKRAVRPLCHGLGDSSAAVRAAAAAGLGKLRLGGKECLRARLELEKSSSVKTVIDKALAQLDNQAKQPPLTDATKLYVAVETNNKSGRSGEEVARLVREGAAKAASSLGSVALVPHGETPQAVKKLLGRHPKVRGFLLSAQVQKPKYARNSLTVRVDVAIFTYPEKNLKGTLPMSLTMQGVDGPDEAAESELIQSAAQRILEKFAQNAERIP